MYMNEEMVKVKIILEHFKKLGFQEVEYKKIYELQNIFNNNIGNDLFRASVFFSYH